MEDSLVARRADFPEGVAERPEKGKDGVKHSRGPVVVHRLRNASSIVPSIATNVLGVVRGRADIVMNSNNLAENGVISNSARRRNCAVA